MSAQAGDLFATRITGTPDTGPQSVDMLSPTGERKTVQARHAGTLRALGYQDITPEIEQQLADKARLGGTLGEIASAGLGFARGSTLGLSDLAARGLENAGALPEGTTDDIRKLKEINPSASLAGELASFIAPGLGAVKALGTAGKVAKGLGAAQAAVGGVGEALGKVAGKIAGEQLGKFVAPAVRTAAEAAIFQAGQNISENSLANKELTAEAVLANTGEAAILGGGLGLGIPLALRGAKAAATAALDSAPVRWVADKAGSQFAKFLDPKHALQIFSGAEGRSGLLLDTPDGKRFRRGVDTLWKEGAYQAGEVAIDPATKKLVKVANGSLPGRREMAQRFSSLEREYRTVLDDIVGQADDAMKASGSRPASFGVSAGEEGKLLDRLIEARASSRVTGSQESTILETLAEDIANARAADSFAALRKLKQGLGSRAYDVRVTGKPAVEITKDLERIVADKLTRGIDEMSPQLAEAWKNANRIESSLISVGNALTKKVAQADANVNILGLRFRDIGIGAVGGGVLGGPAGVAIAMANKAIQSDQGLLARAMLGERMASLGWLQKATQATEKNIAKSVSGFLKGVDAAAIGAAITRPPQLAGAFAATDALTPEVRQQADGEWFADVSGQIAKVAADPEAFAESQAARLGAIAEHAPETTDAIIGKQLQIYAYLAQVMPKNPGHPVSLFAPTWRPSEHEINEFRDVVRVARKPLSILQDLHSGTATRGQTKAIQTLYPTLYQQMLEQVREQVSKPGSELPYDKELKLGFLFPGAVPTMNGSFTLKMSSAPPPDEHSKPPSGYRASGADKMKTGDRNKSKVDTLATR